MSQAELCELTGYSDSAVQNAFTSGHLVVARVRGQLYPAEGVWAEHEWLAAQVLEAAVAVQAGNTRLAIDAVREVFAFTDSLRGGPVAVLPRPKRAAGKEARNVWAWVDEPITGGFVSPRELVGQRFVEALVTATGLWAELGAGDVYPAEMVVASLCRAAETVPMTAVASVARGGWSNSGQVLLLCAFQAAGGSRPLMGQAQKLVSPFGAVVGGLGALPVRGGCR